MIQCHNSLLASNVTFYLRDMYRVSLFSSKAMIVLHTIYDQDQVTPTTLNMIMVREYHRRAL